MSLPSEPEKGRPDDAAENRSQDRSAKEVSSSGWVERLAQRSTGLPEEPSRNERMEPKGGDSSLWRMAGLGIQFAATVAIFAWMGNALDRRMGWSPWGLVSLCLIAVIGNLYLLIKESMRQDGPPKQRNSQPGQQRGEKHDSPHTQERSPPTGGSGASG
jgi:F0F1-type ATP synthase assembly protein I